MTSQVSSGSVTAAPSGASPPAISTEMAFALVLESACEDFENLQDLVRGDTRVVSAIENQKESRPAPFDPKAFRFKRAPGRIQMALAKSFVFGARRANRICTHNKAALALERPDRTRFLKATEPLIAVRDVNEHGFDGDESVRPSMHRQEGGILDETSLMVQGPEKILMGPLNLYTVYMAVDRTRKLAGFLALAEKKRQSRIEARCRNQVLG
jgi:hypothetical protein